MPRYLVLGDPVVALGPAALIPDGALIVEGAQITGAGPIVDEDQVRERFAAAVRDRVYRLPAQVRRWAELGALVEPYLAPAVSALVRHAGRAGAWVQRPAGTRC